MVKPRYDAEKDESRHGATHPDDCFKMVKNQGWDLKRIEKTKTDLLEFDCVFKGKTEFPRDYHDTEKED